MPSPGSTASMAILLSSLTLGCGTQIGNPTASGFDRLTDNPHALSTFVNAAFLQTVDGLNMGDYAYSQSESRVSTERRCETQAGSGFSLHNRADTSHAVLDDVTNWTVRSDLSIKRSYADAWTQNDIRLPCDPQTRAIRLRYDRLQLGPVRLESQVDENLSRIMVLTAKQDKQELRHSMTLRKTGRRSLEFVNYTESNREVILEAELSNQLESTLSLPDEEGGTMELGLELQERFPLAFAIVINPKQEWSRYVIPSGRQEFNIPSSGEVLRLEFRNLTLTREGGCVPASGQMVAIIMAPDGSQERYAVNFQSGTPLVMKQEGGHASFLLAPFACVLKER